MSTALYRQRCLMERFKIVVCYFPSTGKWHVLRNGFDKSEHNTEIQAKAAADRLLYDLQKELNYGKMA